MIRLYKEYSIGVKKLSDADLGWDSSSSSQTHIGLSEQVLKFLPNTPEQRDGILIYNRSCSFVECAFSKIGNKRSTKVDSTTSTPVKSVVRQIRNIASDADKEWILVWFALDNQLPVFWLINSLSDDYSSIKDITGLDFQMKVFKSSMDEYFKLLFLIRTIVKLDNIVTERYENDKDNILLAVSNEHRTFVHLSLDYFRAKGQLDEIYPYFSTTENNMPIKVLKTGRFNLSNMLMFASIDEINRRNSTPRGRRWYSDVFSIKGRDCYLYVDWYPGKNKDGEDEQLMIPDFVNLIQDCYGKQYVYRNSQGTHELWLVNSPESFGVETINQTINLEPLVKPVISNPNPRVWIYSPGEQAKYWDECRQQGLIRLGFDEVGNFQQFDSRQAVLAKMKEVFGANKPHDSLAVWQFLNDMQIGDIVYAKKGVFHIVGRGVVEGDYVYDDNLDELKHCRRIRWTEVGDWDAPFRLPQKTLTRLNADDPNIELLDKTISGTLRTIMPTESFSIKKMIKYIGETGLLYSDSLVKRFAFSLMSKRFLILSGLAGSGKTQLALAFASALVRNKEEQMCLVSVGADWTNREPLLGFPNALDSEKYVKPESKALDLLIEAKRPENADRPFFLILDEMNMSYVERYFADFLSAMESGQEIPLWDKPEECDSDVPPTIKLPKNLFIIGTINVDETTYMFSPKVLDRANVIEFKISPSEMETFLQEMKEIDREGIIGKAAGMGADFVNKACKKDLAQDKEAVDTLQNFFNELKNVNAEFGYRSATEIFRFICQAKSNDDSTSKMTDEEILDAAIVQKLLPKLHGSRKKLEPVLAQLWKLCFVGAGKDLNISKENVEKAQFKESADKIRRMYESATANGFTSFAEA